MSDLPRAPRPADVQVWSDQRAGPAVPPADREAVEAVLREVEPEFGYRRLAGPFAATVAVIAGLMSLFHLYTARFGALEALRQRSAHLAFVMAVVFLLYPPRRRHSDQRRFGVLDVVQALVAVGVMLYVFVNQAALAVRAGRLTTLDLAMGVLGVLVVLEAGRRVLGVLPFIALVLLVYPFVGHLLPGALGVPPVTVARVIEHMFFTTEGIFGIPVGVSATFVFMFVLLGAFLERPGRIEGGAFLHPAPIVPGETRATLRYTADPPARLTFPVTLPTERFDLLVPEGIGVTSDRLTPAGEVTDRGIAYRVFTSSGLSPGEEIVVTLSGLSGGGTASVLAPLLVGVGLAAALGGAFTLRRGAGRRRAGPGAARARSSAGRDRGRHGPARPAPRASAREPARNAPDAAPPDEVDLLIDEIAALDLAHERGLLAPDAYRRLRATAKARLMRLRAERGGAGSEREEGSGCS